MNKLFIPEGDVLKLKRAEVIAISPIKNKILGEIGHDFRHVFEGFLKSLS